MVVGDVFTGDGGLQPLGEGDSYIYVPPPGVECEIANVYVEPGRNFRMRLLDGLTSTYSAFVGFSAPLLNVGIHLTENTTIEINYLDADPTVVALDGIYTRRPPTVFT